MSEESIRLPFVEIEEDVIFYFRPALFKWDNLEAMYFRIKSIIYKKNIFFCESEFSDIVDYMNRKLGDKAPKITYNEHNIMIGWCYPKMSEGIPHGGPWGKLCIILLHRLPDFNITDNGAWYECIRSSESENSELYTITENYIYTPSRSNEVMKHLNTEYEDIYDLSEKLPIPDTFLIKDLYKVDNIPIEIRELLKR